MYPILQKVGKYFNRNQQLLGYIINFWKSQSRKGSKII